MRTGDTVTGALYPLKDGESALGQGNRRWSNVLTLLINGGIPIHSDNYNSYAPKLDGTGATGTWGIDITGSAVYLSTAAGTIPANDRGNLDYTKAFYVGGWSKSDAGYATQYGQFIDISGYSTWYHRFAINTNGLIEHFAGINTKTLTKIGNIAHTNDNVASATKLQTARKLWGQSFDGSGDVSGSLEIYATGSNWNEGIRIHPTSKGWAGIVLCEAANLGSEGTSVNTWSINNYEGVFGIYKNGANTTASAYIANTDGNWSIGGNVGIGTTNPLYKLHVKGNVYVEGNIITTGGVTAASVSDARLKENVRELTGAMDVINRIGVRKFNYNATALGMDATLVGEHAGYIAQEFAAVLPQYTRDMYGCKYLGIQYEKMIPYLTAGLQEVDRKAETLKSVTAAILGVLAARGATEEEREIITNELNKLKEL